MSVITVLTTRNNPKEFNNMIKSLRYTQKLNIFVEAIFDSDDSSIEDYLDLSGELLDSYIIKDKSTITELLNDSQKRNAGKFDFYHLTNDDVIYKTPAWDEIFVNKLTELGGGVTFADDGFQQGMLATFPFINSSIVDSIGWLHMPRLNRYFGDTVWSELASHEGALYKCNNVLIEHLTKYRSMSQEQIKNDLNSNPVYKSDRIAYVNYCLTSAKEDYIKFRLAKKKLSTFRNNKDIVVSELNINDGITGEIE